MVINHGLAYPLQYMWLELSWSLLKYHQEVHRLYSRYRCHTHCHALALPSSFHGWGWTQFQIVYLCFQRATGYSRISAWNQWTKINACFLDIYMPAFIEAYLCSIGMLASIQDGECGIRICFFHSFILHFNMAGGAGNSPEYHTTALQLYITFYYKIYPQRYGG